jgi:hypothetical protein
MNIKYCFFCFIFYFILTICHQNKSIYYDVIKNKKPNYKKECQKNINKPIIDKNTPYETLKEAKIDYDKLVYDKHIYTSELIKNVFITEETFNKFSIEQQKAFLFFIYLFLRKKDYIIVKNKTKIEEIIKADVNIKNKDILKNNFLNYNKALLFGFLILGSAYALYQTYKIYKKHRLKNNKKKISQKNHYKKPITLKA